MWLLTVRILSSEAPISNIQTLKSFHFCSICSGVLIGVEVQGMKKVVTVSLTVSAMSMSIRVSLKLSLFISPEDEHTFETPDRMEGTKCREHVLEHVTQCYISIKF